jgi:uncharacterized protein YcfJ
MSTIPQYSSGKAQSQPHPWLLAAVGALGATTLALGVALVQMRTDPTPVATQTPTPVVALPALSPTASSPVSPSPSVALPESYEQKQPSALVKQAPVATKPVARKSAIPPEASTPPSAVTAAQPNLPDAAQTSGEPVVAALPPPPPKVICAHCGTVTAVTPVEQDGAGSGAGAVAGALLGGLLGNQVGGGTGKTIATVVGAVGGGYAGNTVEKRMKKETVYQIDIRMDDGSTQRLQHRSPLSVGAPVTVNGGVITP